VSAVRRGDDHEVELVGFRPNLLHRFENGRLGVVAKRASASFLVPRHDRSQSKAGRRRDERRVKRGPRKAVAEERDARHGGHDAFSRNRIAVEQACKT
jgi:hypothetical protein